MEGVEEKKVDNLLGEGGGHPALSSVGYDSNVLGSVYVLFSPASAHARLRSNTRGVAPTPSYELPSSRGSPISCSRFRITCWLGDADRFSFRSSHLAP
jgi:hypothetical protein